MPTGKQCLAELTDSQQDEFKKEFIKQKGKAFFDLVMEFEYVHSIGSLLRIIDWDISEKGNEYWKKIFFYYITPKFARDEKRT